MVMSWLAVLPVFTGSLGCLSVSPVTNITGPTKHIRSESLGSFPIAGHFAWVLLSVGLPLRTQKQDIG